MLNRHIFSRREFGIALGALRIRIARGSHDLDDLRAWGHYVRGHKSVVTLPEAPNEALFVLGRYDAFLVEPDGPRLSIDLGANSRELARKWFPSLVRLHAVAVEESMIRISSVCLIPRA